MKYLENVFANYTSKENIERIKCFDSIKEMWEASVKEFANEVALADPTRKVTYAELEEEVAKFRAVLLNKGIKKGDFVGVFAPNTIEWAKAYLALETLGCCAVLLPPHLPEQALFGCGIKFQMKAIIYHPALQAKIDALNAMPHKMALINVMESSEEKAAFVEVGPKDPAVIIFTGGTTGKSKGALLNNKALCRGTCNGCYGIPDVFKQRYLLILPLTHVFGLVRNLLTNFQTGSIFLK